jgi:hypothetical protein
MHGCCTQVDALLDSQNARARKLVLQHTDKILALSEHLSKHKVRVCLSGSTAWLLQQLMMLDKLGTSQHNLLLEALP